MRVSLRLANQRHHFTAAKIMQQRRRADHFQIRAVKPQCSGGQQGKRTGADRMMIKQPAVHQLHLHTQPDNLRLGRNDGGSPPRPCGDADHFIRGVGLRPARGISIDSLAQ